MNKKEELEKLLELLPNRPLLRSRSAETFLQLDNSGKPEISEKTNKSVLESTLPDQTFSQIEDPGEREEAYQELVKTLNVIIRKERDENLEILEKNTNFIKELREENSVLKDELELTYENLSNAKALLEETNNKLYSAQDKLRNNDYTFLQEKIERLKNTIAQKNESIEQYKLDLELLSLPKSHMAEEETNKLKTEIGELKSQLEQAQSTIQEQNTNLNQSKPRFEFDKLESQLTNFQTDWSKRENELQNKISELEIKILEKENPSKNIQTSDQKSQSNPSNKMELQAKDIISAIPIFAGDMKQFDGFINTCSVYYDIVPENEKAFVLRIIKAKITGDALSKAGSFDDSINTWELLKDKLKTKLRKPVSIEYAQEDLNNSFQKRDESIEEFGTKMKGKLKKLNEACRSLAKSDEELKILRKMNEKQAISKFEQNLRNQTIKVLVSAAGKTSLDECITFAMQKDMIERNKNIKQCGYCGLSNHQENSCRKKQNDNDKRKSMQNKSNGNGNGNGQNNSNNYKKPFNNDRKESYSNQKNDNNGRSQPNKNQQQNADKSKIANQAESSSKNFLPRNVKTLQSDDSEDITVKEALQRLDESKN